MSKTQTHETKILEKVIENIINNPEKYDLSAIKFASLAKTVGIKNMESSWFDKIYEQGWGTEDLKVSNVSAGGDNITIWIEAPNGYTANIRASTKRVSELSKDEYVKFKQMYDALTSKLTIKEMEEEIKKKDEMIKKLTKEIEELKEEKRKIEEYCDEKRKEYDITYEDARNMLSFLNEKGLIDKYIDWLNERDKEEIKAKMMSYYGLIEDDDC